MKKFIALAAVIAFMYSCNSGDRGELVGEEERAEAKQRIAPHLAVDIEQ